MGREDGRGRLERGRGHLAHLDPVRVVVQQENSGTGHFLCLHHSLQVSQEGHMLGHVCGQHLKERYVKSGAKACPPSPSSTLSPTLALELFSSAELVLKARPSHQDPPTALAPPTMSMTILRRLCRWRLLRFWKMSQFSSCSSLNPTARWWFSSTDSSLYINASSESAEYHVVPPGYYAPPLASPVSNWLHPQSRQSQPPLLRHIKPRLFLLHSSSG